MISLSDREEIKIVGTTLSSPPLLFKETNPTLLSTRTIFPLSRLDPKDKFLLGRLFQSIYIFPPFSFFTNFDVPVCLSARFSFLIDIPPRPRSVSPSPSPSRAIRAGRETGGTFITAGRKGGRVDTKAARNSRDVDSVKSSRGVANGLVLRRHRCQDGEAPPRERDISSLNNGRKPESRLF